MLKDLRQRVCKANRDLVEMGLVMRTWGNVSGLSDDRAHMVIKPSGVPYETLDANQLVVMAVADGKVVEGDLRPSSDAPTHLALYRAFDSIGGIVHTHSLHATAWAQAQKEIPPMGTTHADHFAGPVPLTRRLSDDEIDGEYETNTGRVIIERFEDLDPLQCPGVLVNQHGPFAWGADVDAALESAEVMEFLAELAGQTLAIHAYPKPVSEAMLARHFLRKHGPDATYGQK